MTLLITVVAITLFVSGFCSLLEATLYSTRMGVLESEAAGGRHQSVARRFIRMKRDIAEPTSAILILNTIANTAGATVSGMVAARELGPEWIPGFSALLTLGILFLSEILPKTYGATHWHIVWPFVVWPLAAIQTGLKPMVKVTEAFSRFFTGSGSVSAITEDEIRAMIRLGAKAGELTLSEQQLLNAVFRFDDLVCRQVMVPRRDVVIFLTDYTLQECLEIARRTQHTRYPVCRDSLDNAIGLIHMKDLLGVPLEQGIDLTSIARPIRSVPETMPISRLLREMQSTHQHMAIVVDEFGTAVGIITLELVIEQIVGAVQDEFDTESPEVVPEGPGVYSVHGQLPIDRLNRELGLDLYSEDADTLSGLMVSELNRLLRVGDTLEIEGATAEVLEVQSGRATRVRLRLHESVSERRERQGEES